MSGHCPKMLDHHLGLLSEVVWMETYETGQRTCGFAFVELGIVLNGLYELEVGLIGRVVLQDIENEAFLNGLPHAVNVKWFWLTHGIRAAKALKRLVLRSCGK